jgi:hypothetical protein
MGSTMLIAPSLSTLSLCVHHFPPVRITLALEIRQAVDGLRAHGWDGPTAQRPVIFAGDNDGYLRQVEIAVDPD